MRKGYLLLLILFVSILFSCTEAEAKYKKKLWEHKERMLDLEYTEELIKVIEYAELKLLIMKLDSVKTEMQQDITITKNKYEHQ